jgi:hypothetical protein
MDNITILDIQENFEDIISDDGIAVYARLIDLLYQIDTTLEAEVASDDLTKVINGKLTFDNDTLINIGSRVVKAVAERMYMRGIENQMLGGLAYNADGTVAIQESMELSSAFEEFTQGEVREG